MNATIQHAAAPPVLAGARQRPVESAEGARLNPQMLARATGVLFLITYATSIPAALSLYVPALTDRGYVTGAGAADMGVLLGAFLELLLIVANIGTTLTLFPVLKRQNEALALGFVTARLVESAFIAVGLLSMLTLVTLRREAVGADPAALTAVGQALVALHDWTFALGPGWVVGVGNGMILGYLMYRSGLVPRPLAALGLIGGPLVCASGTAVLFGLVASGSAGQFLPAMPEFFWELLLGLYLTIWGFRPQATKALMGSA